MRTGSTEGGAGTSPSGGTGGGGTMRSASCRARAAPRSTLPRATPTSSAEPAIFEGAAIDHPKGFGPEAAWSCQQACTSFITLDTFPETPPLQAVVQSRETAPFAGPSTTV